MIYLIACPLAPKRDIPKLVVAIASVGRWMSLSLSTIPLSLYTLVVFSNRCGPEVGPEHEIEFVFYLVLRMTVHIKFRYLGEYI